MLKKILVLSVILFVVNIHLRAQHTLILPDEYLAVKDDDFKIDSVIDLRLFNDHIGVVQKGLLNRQVSVNFPDRLPIYLTAYLKENYSKTGQPLILVVSDFAIGEETKALSEKGFAETSLTMCRRDSTGELKSLFTFSDRVESSGLDVTMGHPKRVKDLLTLFLTQFIASDWKNNPGETFEFGVEPNQQAYRLHEMQTFSPGLYTSVDELINNQPVISITDIKVSAFKEQHVKIKNQNELIGNKRAFAFSDGQQLYISSAQYQSYRGASYFAPVRETGRFFLIDDPYGAINPSRGLMTAAGIGFGVIGGAVAGLAASQMPASGNGFIIDFKTGKTHLFNEQGILRILEEFPDAKERYLSKKNRRTMGVWRSCLVYLNRLNHTGK